MATLPPSEPDSIPVTVQNGKELAVFQRLGFLRQNHPGVPLYVLQCCANDAKDFTLPETEKLFQEKYDALKAELAAQRKQQVLELTELLPTMSAQAAAAAATPKPAPKKKKDRLQGGAGKKTKPKPKATPDDSQPVTASSLLSRDSAWTVFAGRALEAPPPYVELRPGLVLIKNALDLAIQQQFADVSFALGTPTEEMSCGWYTYREKKMQWNQGDYGQMLEETQAFPHQYHDLASSFLTLARRLSPCLPDMDPSICLVNFYPQHSKGIAWHRDNSRTEKQSAAAGVPVVSVSIGDSADFCYKMEWGETAKVACLNSGDVLVFGGPSRLIYHAVTKIYPNTAPKQLKMKTPGRLNLTFRHADKENEGATLMQ
eukprot:TRINITY_DN66302_c3_g1_i1.p1 TRINITY_DN66302_c3_g1~~TRINITY_DN66302_c3_g1_i1.p1  ORF type:complete len:372 (+),score=47.20 TRINITY_DN66302_c3_g1_i1:53-1168(+)